ncbi:MAG: YiiD C-terminal domain-containing protein [Verrucomicrobiota bacterium]
MPRTEQALEEYLHTHIPLSRAMQASVKQATSKQVVLFAPIAPNINHRETVFGGSASALAILAAWGLIHIRMKSLPEYKAQIVIQRNSIEYKRPILKDFEAICSAPSISVWSFFTRCLQKRGIGRLVLSSELTCEGQKVGSFEGSFVVTDLDR